MSRFMWLIFLLVQLTKSAEIKDDNSIDSCLRRDSISCVQIYVYRKLRSFFNEDSIELLGGFRLVKNDIHTDESRAFKAQLDEEVLERSDVAERESALEEYAYEKITNFFKERSLKWSLAPAMSQVSTTARMAMDSIPQDIKEKITSYMTEGRGKKKILKALIPILIGAKLKITAFLGLVYVTIALIAKKALLSSVIALAIILFVTIKKHFSQPHVAQIHEVHGEPYHGWSHPTSDRWTGGGGWDPSYNSYDTQGSSPHHIAYSGQKQTKR